MIIDTAVRPDPARALKTIFGYSSFRPIQKDVIDTVIDGKDAIVLMPTGGGKSLCFQIPAIVSTGCALVVSPLISLMQDQVSALQQLGVAAAYLNSTLSSSEARAVIDQLINNQLDLLYVAPERLFLNSFHEQLKNVTLSLFAIDEAHCISEWGHAFRPDYRLLHQIKSTFPNIPMVALTATATPQVLEDIKTQLSLQNATLFQGSFNRTNLFYEVRQKKNTFNQILRFIQARPGQAGIIYCMSRNQVDNMTAKLIAANINAMPYHAGLSDTTRQQNQLDFIRDNVDIIVATIAFGMGIDKPDVRFVIHHDLPKTLENYYQETGRAGRDGQDSHCLLFYSYADKFKYDNFIREMSNERERQQSQIKLNQIVQFAFKSLCRRRQLLQYFGERYEESHCGACDICLNPPEYSDMTVVSQKILSCIYRVRQRFGSGVIIAVLKGDDHPMIQRYQLNQLSVYGIEKDLSKMQLKDVIQYLNFLDYIHPEGNDYPVLKLTEKAKAVLRGDETIMMPVFTSAAKKDSTKKKADAVHYDYDAGLFEQLRQYRKQLSDERGVPPYVIFHDKTLKEIAAVNPQCRDDLLAITGIGEKKADDVGLLFLKFMAQLSG